MLQALGPRGWARRGGHMPGPLPAELPLEAPSSPPPQPHFTQRPPHLNRNAFLPSAALPTAKQPRTPGRLNMIKILKHLRCSKEGAS